MYEVLGKIKFAVLLKTLFDTLEGKYREENESESFGDPLKSSLDTVPTRDPDLLRKYLNGKSDIKDGPRYNNSRDFSNMTDSRAVRETDIRFVNNGLSDQIKTSEHTTNRPKTTRVEVTVPGSVPITLQPAKYTSAEPDSRDFVVTRNGELIRKENMRKIVPRDITFSAPSGGEDGNKARKVAPSTSEESVTGTSDKPRKKFKLDFDSGINDNVFNFYLVFCFVFAFNKNIFTKII